MKKIKSNLTRLAMVLLLNINMQSTYAETPAASFTLPDFYAQTPVDRVRSEVVREWPRFTFLEGVLSTTDGSILVSDYSAGKVYLLKENQMKTLLSIDGKLLCFSRIRGDANHFMVTAWITRKDRVEGALLKFAMDGSYETVARFPEESFLNGITQLPDGRFLIAGSATGIIWFYDPITGDTGRWYQGDLTTGQHGMPGINGIQVLDNTVYFTNTSKFVVGKIVVDKGGRAGEVKLLAKDVLLDDFAIAPDTTIYGATHRDEILRIKPNGDKSIIAQYDQGVTGSTSVTWDSDASGSTLLVATNGGINHKLFGRGESSVVPAKVVRLFLNQRK